MSDGERDGDREPGTGLFRYLFTRAYTLGGLLKPGARSGMKNEGLHEAAAGILTALAFVAIALTVVAVLGLAVEISWRYLGPVWGTITVALASYVALVGSTSRTIGRKDAAGAYNLYLRRFYLTPRIPFFNVRFFLHHILRSDDDTWPHDHPWRFVTLILAGKYIEHVFHPTTIREWATKKVRVLSHERHATPGTVLRNQATHTHKLEIVRPVWSLVLAGAGERDWGFWVMDGTGPDRWVQWEEYLDIKKGTEVHSEDRIIKAKTSTDYQCPGW